MEKKIVKIGVKFQFVGVLFLGLFLFSFPKSSFSDLKNDPPTSLRKISTDLRSEHKINNKSPKGIKVQKTLAFKIEEVTTELKWTQLYPSTKPSPRYFHAMAYDAARGKVILFGGHDDSGYLDDTWEWNGTDWTQLFPTSKPSKRAFCGIAYDAAREKIVLFGGSPAPYSYLDDTWEWDGTDWTPLFPSSKPSPRDGFDMIYDPALGQAVLFGGADSGVASDETWAWDGTNWTHLNPDTKPSARASYGMAYDTAREKLVIFGGSNGAGYLDDTWEWDGTDWTPISPSSAPSKRSEIRMAYDPALGQMVLFGGLCSGYYPTLDDTWVWGGTNWTEIYPSAKPSQRSRYGMVYDATRGQIVLFGGLNYDGSKLDDTWVWEKTNVTPTIQVTSPNGGEPWVRGTTEYITWDQSGLTGTIRIALYKGNALAQNLGTAAAHQGVLIWNIPSSLALRDDYRIRIYQGSIQDYSDGYFSITAATADAIEITSPNGGELWEIGVAKKITWNTTGLSGTVTIELYKGGQFYKKLGTPPATAKTFNWTIPTTTAPGDDYRIKISKGIAYDTSNYDFSLFKDTSNIAFEYRGMSLTDKTANGYISIDNSIKKMQDNNINFVAVNVFLYQQTSKAYTIFQDLQKTASDAALISAINNIKDPQRNMKVMLKVNVECSDGSNSSSILPDPENMQAWFNSYANWMIHYASIAEQQDVDIFSVGTGFKLLSSDLENWGQIIGSVRQVYLGKLIYSANWDEYDKVPFWDYLDYIGINAYFPLESNSSASPEQLKADWSSSKPSATAFRGKNWISIIDTFRKSKGKDVIFTEIGYPSVEGGADTPYKQTWPDTAKIRLDLQRKCYEGAIKAWQGKTWFKGMFWWEWYADNKIDNDPTYGDNKDHSPLNKPAWDTLGEMYGSLIGLKASLNPIWWGPHYFDNLGDVDPLLGKMNQNGVNAIILNLANLNNDGSLSFSLDGSRISGAGQKIASLFQAIQSNSVGKTFMVYVGISNGTIKTLLDQTGTTWQESMNNLRNEMPILLSYLKEFPGIYRGLFLDLEEIGGNEYSGNRKAHYEEIISTVKNMILYSGRRLIVHAGNIKLSYLSSWFWPLSIYNSIFSKGADYITTNSYDFGSAADTVAKYQKIIQDTVVIIPASLNQKVVLGLSGSHLQNAGSGESIPAGVNGYYAASEIKRRQLKGLFIYVGDTVENALDDTEWTAIRWFILGY